MSYKGWWRSWLARRSHSSAEKSWGLEFEPLSPQLFVFLHNLREKICWWLFICYIYFLEKKILHNLLWKFVFFTTFSLKICWWLFVCYICTMLILFKKKFFITSLQIWKFVGDYLFAIFTMLLLVILLYLLCSFS